MGKNVRVFLDETREFNFTTRRKRLEMKFMKVIIFLSNVGISMCAGGYDESENPLEWGSALLDWIQTILP